MERINLKFESIPETKFSQFFFGLPSTLPLTLSSGGTMLKQRRRQGFAALLAVPLCAVEGFSFLSRPVLLKDRGSRAGVKIFSRSNGADGPPPLPPGFDVVPGDGPWAKRGGCPGAAAIHWSRG